MEDEGRESRSPDFGTLLRRHRLAAGLSQDALAERAGLSLQGISALERGHRRTPQRDTLALLASALALSEGQRRAFEAAAAPTSSPRRRGETAITAGRWPISVRVNLPLSLISFVGRRVELNEIDELVRQHRLVTLTGAGGIGKTQTALQAARAQHEATQSPVCFVELAPIGDPSLVSTAIASALGVHAVPNRPLLHTIIAYLKNKLLLLTLDNCEHVIKETATVARDLLSGCPGVRILATSREPLRAAGERTYRLPTLAPDEAIALFTDRVQAGDGRFRLTNQTALIIDKICQRLDRIPLAIELAAARANVLTLNQLVDNLDDRLRILTVGDRTAPPRQQTMRATIDWSYDLLSAPERRLFERLSIFAGGCTLATATTVCANDDFLESDALHLLSSLVGKSLVTADLSASEPRYSQLESFREYARARLEARGEAPIIAHRHALAFLEIAETLPTAHEFEHRLSWEPRVREERENWHAALRWTLANDGGDSLLGQRLISALVNSYVFQFGEAQHWIDAAVERLDQGTPRSVIAALNLAQATISQNTSNYNVELISSDKAFVEFQALGDWFGVTKAQTHKGHALMFLGHRAEAQGLFADTLKFARDSGLRDGYSTAFLLRMLAYTSDIVAARGYFREALSILQALGERPNTAYALLDLAACEFLAGNVEEACMRATEALATGVRAEHVLARCASLSNLATFLIALNRWDEAAERARESLRLACENDWSALAAWNILNLTAIAVLQRQSDADRGAALHRASRLLGFVDARLAALGSAQEPIHQQERDRALAALQEELGTESVAKLTAEGATIDEGQASEEAFAIITRSLD